MAKYNVEFNIGSGIYMKDGLEMLSLKLLSSNTSST